MPFMLPAPVLRYAGREPKCTLASSASGVAVCNSSNNAESSCTVRRNTRNARSERSAIVSSKRFSSPSGNSLRKSVRRAITAALSMISRLRSATLVMPNFWLITSPCSVTFTPGPMLPGGNAAKARYTGEPPPRPTVPPRPWNRDRATPARRATPTSSSCARYRIHAAASTPTSFAESE